jgi:uncharacterized protein YcbK (DUF882 family)
MLDSRRNFLSKSVATLGTLGMGSAFASEPLTTGLVPSGALKLYHIHTTETLQVEYRQGHAIIASALCDIDYLLRDFRTGQVTTIDFDLIDLLSGLYDQFGRRGRFEVISGYRSPRTNSALRKITTGVAEDSFHMSGRAIDVRLVGTQTAALRDAALALRRGGVGYYPDSNFVHIDTGTVRSW